MIICVGLYLGMFAQGLSSQFITDIDFGSMNIDNHPNTPTQYGVRGIPTCILVVGGELKSTKVGMTKKTDFLSWLKENI